MDKTTESQFEGESLVWSAPSVIVLGCAGDSRGGYNPAQNELYAGGTPIGALSP